MAVAMNGLRSRVGMRQETSMGVVGYTRAAVTRPALRGWKRARSSGGGGKHAALGQCDYGWVRFASRAICRVDVVDLQMDDLSGREGAESGAIERRDVDRQRYHG